MQTQKIAVFTILILTSLATLLILANSTTQLACEAQAINLALPLRPQNQIWGDNMAVQTFQTTQPNLNRLDIFLQTYFRHNTADVTIRLVDITDNLDLLNSVVTPLFETTLNASTLPAQSWQSFTFPAITNSAQKYAIIIAAPQATPGNAITFGGIENANPYESGEATLGGTPFPGDVAFRACFQMSLGEKLTILSRQMTQHRPFVWGNSAFYGGMLLLYGGLVGLLFWRLVMLKD